MLPHAYNTQRGIYEYILAMLSTPVSYVPCSMVYSSYSFRLYMYTCNVRVFICIYTIADVYMHITIYTYLYMHACMHECMRAHTHTHLHTHFCA